MRALLETAEIAARAGGRVLETSRGELGAVRSKAWAHDFVTDVDVASGVAVVRAIQERITDARFVIEEDEVHGLAGVKRGRLDDTEVWVIDPLDGTTSFVHGYPTYSVSVAVLRDGQPVAGAVYNAAAGEMNSAALGLGARRDGAAIHASDTASVQESLLITGFPYDRGAALDRQLAVLGAFLRAPVHGIRRDGSAAVDCCHVAGGRADGFWEYTLRAWDMAAGVVILREAGATVSDVSGNPWTAESDSICTASPELHARMLEVIASASL
ncbi:MAG: inositol monophosphatase [Coriobacteriia bacterium]|nr:inositol monophosphatase [Coriobacteriia bacterium]